jgi:hypothetical protein
VYLYHDRVQTARQHTFTLGRLPRNKCAEMRRKRSNCHDSRGGGVPLVFNLVAAGARPGSSAPGSAGRLGDDPGGGHRVCGDLRAGRLGGGRRSGSAAAGSPAAHARAERVRAIAGRRGYGSFSIWWRMAVDPVARLGNPVCRCGGHQRAARRRLAEWRQRRGDDSKTGGAAWRRHAGAEGGPARAERRGTEGEYVPTEAGSSGHLSRPR